MVGTVRTVASLKLVDVRYLRSKRINFVFSIVPFKSRCISRYALVN